MVQKIFTGQIKELDKEMIQALERVLLPGRHSAASRKEYPEASAARVCETDAVYGVQKSFCTLADYYALPDDRRAELIDGVIYDMSAPSLAHQAVSAEIFSQLRDYIARKKGKCKYRGDKQRGKGNEWNKGREKKMKERSDNNQCYPCEIMLLM